MNKILFNSRKVTSLTKLPYQVEWMIESRFILTTLIATLVCDLCYVNNCIVLTTKKHLTYNKQ